ncbi:MAG TPA: hypothetical protein VEB18_02750 [Candidatus Paceibacterota bacterium]|nr:hypothetical protein [Candidatus Paceibacterota bacterium]
MKVRRVEDIEKDTLDAKLEDSIFLRVIDYGLGYPEGFTYPQLVSGLKLKGWETKIVNEYLETAYKNAYNAKITGQRGNAETPFFIVEQGDGGGFMHEHHKYIVGFDAHFKFIDYHELKSARENAKEAKKLAVIAIAVSVLAAFISAVAPIVVAQVLTQTVKLDPAQIETIQNSINDIPHN